MFSTIHDFAEMLHTTYLNIQYVLCMISQTHEHDKFFAFLIVLPILFHILIDYDNVISHLNFVRFQLL